MRKHRHPDIFLSLCGILTILTVLFIGTNVIVMTFQGTRSFLSNVMRTETLFAIGLSVRTACVSTLLCFLLAVPTSFILERTSFPLRPVVETALELTMSLNVSAILPASPVWSLGKRTEKSPLRTA